jgi:hypothetical protein
MASFLEGLLKQMQNAPHVGIPPVTNPKVPTKVERDAAEYAARERAKPKADYGSGSSFDQLMRRIASSQHPEMRFGDPAFNGGFNDAFIDLSAYEDEFQQFMAALKANTPTKVNMV